MALYRQIIEVFYQKSKQNKLELVARPGPNQTAKIAVKSIGEGKCQIHTRSKIKADDPVLSEATSRSGSSVYLMYPNRNSVDVKTLKSQHKSSTISKLSNFGSLERGLFF